MVFANERRRLGMLLSPLLVIVLGMLTQRAAGPALGAWSWLPTILVFWCSIAGAIALCRRDRPLTIWLARPRGSVGWSIAAVGMGLASAREFMSGWHSLLSLDVFILWLVVGLVNPWFEESYWRGALIDAAGKRKVLGVAYSALAFAVSHPLIWGVHSVALRRPASMVGLGIAGIVWGIVYWRTGSLRWIILGHGCADLLGLSVPVLLNRHLPAWAG
jgi:membrane protease YdiL (CAAX protease family)